MSRERRAEGGVPVGCNCLALRQAARRITQLYDAALSPVGLRTMQYSILVRLDRAGPWTVNALAERLVMDRTTLGRALRPLLRDGLARMAAGADDRRSRVVSITEDGRARLTRATPAWEAAQVRLEGAFGPERAAALRQILAELASLKVPG